MPNAGPYEIISVEAAEERFDVSRDVEYPFADFNDEQPIRLYPGGLRIEGDFEPELPEPADWIPYNVIIDGDLVVDGNVAWWDYGSGNFVLVTGSVRARNVLLEGCTTFVVRGDLTADNGIQGHHGDDGGFLDVHGATRAKIVVNTLYFNMSFGPAPQAVVIGDEYRTDCPLDFDDEEVHDLVEPDLLDEDGRADEHLIEKALKAGRPILRPGVKPAHIAALEKLDALLTDAEAVTELDLSDRKLRAFPEQLYRFPNLRRLSLAGNQFGPLPDRLGELTSLEELDLSKMGLEELPAAIGRLPELLELDVSGNPLTLPEEIGDLSRLRVLRADDVNPPLPDAMDRLGELTELSLRGLGSRLDDRAVDFPEVVTRLSGLRVLDLTRVPLKAVPDRLLELRELEELWLDSSLALVTSLPDLSRLPSLRILHMDGLRSWTDRPNPGQELLDGVWAISTLQELYIDRWGSRDDEGYERPPLTALPDDAFARMPDLRRLDLSFNDLTTLPESLFALRHLKWLDLRYTRLDAETLDRLRTAFPEGVRLDLRDIPSRNDVDDPEWQRIHGLVKEGAQHLRHDRAAALERFEQAIALCAPGARYSEYDELYALYGAVDALSHLAVEAEGDDRRSMVDRLVDYGERALAAVPPGAMIWHYTDFGAFQEEVVRRTGNSLAWQLMERGDLDRALAVVDRALVFGAEPDFDFIRDTKVRILLRMGRFDEAYLIVDQVLARDPDFGDFQDLRGSQEFARWRREHSAR